MKKNLSKTKRLRRHIDIQQQPHRVAARLEGVVKNRGIKPKKKEPAPKLPDV